MFSFWILIEIVFESFQPFETHGLNLFMDFCRMELLKCFFFRQFLPRMFTFRVCLGQTWRKSSCRRGCRQSCILIRFFASLLRHLTPRGIRFNFTSLQTAQDTKATEKLNKNLIFLIPFSNLIKGKNRCEKFFSLFTHEKLFQDWISGVKHLFSVSSPETNCFVEIAERFQLFSHPCCYQFHEKSFSWFQTLFFSFTIKVSGIVLGRNENQWWEAKTSVRSFRFHGDVSRRTALVLRQQLDHRWSLNPGFVIVNRGKIISDSIRSESRPINLISFPSSKSALRWMIIPTWKDGSPSAHRMSKDTPKMKKGPSFSEIRSKVSYKTSFKEVFWCGSELHPHLSNFLDFLLKNSCAANVKPRKNWKIKKYGIPRNSCQQFSGNSRVSNMLSTSVFPTAFNFTTFAYVFPVWE